MTTPDDNPVRICPIISRQAHQKPLSDPSEPSRRALEAQVASRPTSPHTANKNRLGRFNCHSESIEILDCCSKDASLVRRSATAPFDIRHGLSS